MSVEHWFIPWFRWLFMLVISVLTNKKTYIWSGARSELKKSEKSVSVQWRTLKSWGTVVQGHFKNDKKIWLLRKNIKRWGLFWWLHIFFHYYFFILATSMTFCVLMSTPASFSSFQVKSVFVTAWSWSIYTSLISTPIHSHEWMKTSFAYKIAISTRSYWT